MELWLPIQRLNNKYEVSNLGRIRNTKTGKPRVATTRQGGYQYVTALNSAGKCVAIQVHRAVMLAFQPITNPEQAQVHHKDHNPYNNELGNLQWTFSTENQVMKATIMRKKCKKLLGEMISRHGVVYTEKKLRELLS